MVLQACHNGPLVTLTCLSSNCATFCKLFTVQNHIELLFDFINLTQVHNFTVSAQDVFTFRRLSVFTASFTGRMNRLYLPTG